jgi:hypothetical protein
VKLVPCAAFHLQSRPYYGLPKNVSTTIDNGK